MPPPGDQPDTLLARILEGRQANYEAQDKAILTLSSGGLIASISFVKDIVPIKEAILMWVLIVSWIMFVVSIFAVLASFVLSQHAHDLRYEQERCSDPSEKGKIDEQCRSACSRVENCNRFAVAFLIAALILTVAFAAPNALIMNGRL